MNPATVGGSALVTAQLAILIGTLFPSLTADQAGAIAGLNMAIVAAAHQAARWWIAWRWPQAPTPP
jgi:hypothetical protein